jgi:transcription-repair coupling factor (superfamily II helicase)
MNLAPLLAPIRKLSGYRDLLQRAVEGTPGAPAEHLPRAARPPVLAALAQDLRAPLLVLLPRGDRMLTLAEELKAWTPHVAPLQFPEPGPLFYERAPWGPRARRQRAAVLSGLTAAAQPGGPETALTPRLVLATARAAMTRTLTPRMWLTHSRWLTVGGQRRPAQLVRLLAAAGYTQSTVVAEPGQYSQRGGILDLWPPAETEPVRVEFFGDVIDSLRTFDPSSQRSVGSLDAVRVTPAREALPELFQQEWLELLPPEAAKASPGEPQEPYLEYFLPWMNPNPTGLLDFLPPDTRVVVDDQMALEVAINEFETQAVSLRRDLVESGRLPERAAIPYLTLPEIEERLRAHAAIDLGMSSADLDAVSTLGDHFRVGPRFGGQLKPLMDHLSARQLAHEPVVVVSRQADRLSELWHQAGSGPGVQDTPPDTLVPGEIVFIQGALSDGWTLIAEDGPRVHLLTDSEAFGWARPQPRRRGPQRVAAPESDFADLSSGDIVVHVDYGIGRYAGLVERTLSGLRREYLLIEYGGGGQVYVPVHQADRITRYVGVDGREPALSRLGTSEWERVRERAAESVEEVARDLLTLYASRMTIRGHAYSPDTPWQRELEASFPYAETDDQLRAIQAVKNDMESDRPMDRLICGDVGYGKTEVALRAAFKAMMDNRQVAMLVPTTILAQQHFNTFRSRLAAYPATIEMLSRFRSRSEAAEIVERLKAGEVDIVIGTHRLLQPDVEFRHLGLLIIDEEQRFGVTHKEYLKRMRTEVDVLTMTATPIPRTLYMALTGVRDISTIETPPEERLPVITHVGHYDPRLVRQAILREYDRGGQVFFVHNRVQTIDRIQQRLDRLVPEVRIGVAHGQMPEGKLAEVMEQFSAGEIDVLVSTSIIESGLDIPNANTLIVDRADRFGLAQLYQLRGRVGRGPVRGYSYFLRRPHSHATEEALERLQVIAEHSQLGAGYSIAMRDLELRGAGDILGTRQHGQITAVGFHLYTRLLSSAVRRLRQEHSDVLPQTLEAQATDHAIDVAVELPLPSALPPDYVQDRELRLRLYRRMAGLRELSEVDALRDELADRFGPPSEEVDNLLYQLRIRIMASTANVTAVGIEGGQFLLQMSGPHRKILPSDLGSDVRVSRRGLWLKRGEGRAWQSRLSQVLEALATIPARKAVEA